MNIEQIKAFIVQLANHDWFYDYSDDDSVWRAGKNTATELEAAAAKEPVLADLHTAYARYNYDSTFGTWEVRAARRDEEVKNIFTKYNVAS